MGFEKRAMSARDRDALKLIMTHAGVPVNDVSLSVIASIRDAAHAAGREDAAKLADEYAASQRESAGNLREKYPDAARGLECMAEAITNLAADIRDLARQGGENDA